MAGGRCGWGPVWPGWGPECWGPVLMEAGVDRNPYYIEKKFPHPQLIFLLLHFLVSNGSLLPLVLVSWSPPPIPPLPRGDGSFGGQ